MLDAIIGPTPLAGIGQQGMKYSRMLGCPYVMFDEFEKIPEGSSVMIYALPIPQWFERIPNMKKRFKKVMLMTICETETVHEDYGKLFEHFDHVATPSKFCQRIFQRQFPETKFHVVNAYVDDPGVSVLSYKPKDWRNTKYTFYHIGNVADQRKNINGVIRAFVELFSDKTDQVRLLLKATCNQVISVDTPGVEVINGLLSGEDLDKVHDQGDCYVSCSHSEGIGLGAVEAALRAKPVIMAEYGGGKDYINSTYTVPCRLTEIQRDDFLFKKGMLWGDPDYNKLKEFMQKAFETRDCRAGHPMTQYEVSKEKVMRQLNVFESQCI
jgi:glycosyltransferase involved in cell wall biosynthesis